MDSCSVADSESAYYLSIRPSNPAPLLRLYRSKTRAAAFGIMISEFGDYTTAIREYLSIVGNHQYGIRGAGMQILHDHSYPRTQHTIAESTGVFHRRNRGDGDRVYTSRLHQAVVRADMGDYDHADDCGDGRIALCYNSIPDTVIRVIADLSNRHLLTVMLREEL